MIIHWSKQINIEQIGKRVVRVQCSNCACEFFYKLIRVGVGTGTAPYSIGVARATRNAQKQANEDLERRLKSGAELVPCPNCLWINEELILAYRLGRYPNVGSFAVACAVIGTCVFLCLVWFYFVDPRAPRESLPYVLVGGTSFWLMAAGLIGIRNFLRSRIQPNRFFPHAPKLPPGIPTALVIDASSGALVPAASNLPQSEFTNGWLDFRIGNDHLPKQCCDCLQNAPSGLGHNAQVSKTMYLEIPRCIDCARLVKRAYWRHWFTIATSGLFLVGATAALMGLRPPELWFIIGGAFIALLALASIVASISIRPVRVSGRETSRGVVKLRFRNPEYASLVASHLSNL
jgi:hypothetical protein